MNLEAFTTSQQINHLRLLKISTKDLKTLHDLFQRGKVANGFPSYVLGRTLGQIGRNDRFGRLEIKVS